jgi:hypothetical protein
MSLEAQRGSQYSKGKLGQEREGVAGQPTVVLPTELLQADAVVATRRSAVRLAV